MELMTRAFAKAKFGEAMEGTVKPAEVAPLRAVLFDSAYPTPPLEWFKGAISW